MAAVRERAVDLLVKYGIIDNEPGRLVPSERFCRLWEEHAARSGGAYGALVRSISERVEDAEGDFTRAMMLSVFISMIRETRLGRRVVAERGEAARMSGDGAGYDPEYARRFLREARREMESRRL